MAKPVEQLSEVIVRFAGDSGDGMQLTGAQFTSETALLGNDISTLPDFPAEIRAPAGSLAGVSGFQLHFADHDILTPGDAPNVLVAMNPAALKTNLHDLPKGGTLIVDSDAFNDRNLQKAGYATNPLEDGSLDEYQLHSRAAHVAHGRGAEGRRGHHAARGGALEEHVRARADVVALRPLDRASIDFLDEKFGKRRPEIAEANIKALQAGYAFGETTETFAVTYEVKPAKLKPGTYRNITGNQALAYGLIAASKLSGLPLFLGAYPITPASAILEELAGYKNFGVRTFQAEDEIAAAGAAVGAAFGGMLGVTTSAGPGIVLKAETIGLAIMLELPLVICDIQRAGPSTGMPTKPEQGDLLMVLFGRNGESPVPVVAAHVAVGLLRRGDRGVPDRAEVPHAGVPALGRVPRERLRAVAAARRRRSRRTSRRRSRPRRTSAASSCRTCATSGRSRARGRCRARRASSTGSAASRRRTAPATSLRPGQPRADDAAARAEGRRHRRATSRSSRSTTPTATPNVLVLGWGGTYGPIAAACKRVRRGGRKVAHAHLRHLNPFPRNTRRGAAPLRQGARAGDEPRPAAEARPRRVPRRRGRLQPRARPAAARRRGRGTRSRR